MFVMQQIITDYLEIHHILSKVSRTTVHKVYHVLRSTAIKTPVVDQFVKNYLKSHFPKQEDSELVKLQSAMLRACGQLTCLWSNIIDANMIISVHYMLSVIQ